MEKQNKLHKLWPAHIGEFYNPEHNEIKKNLLNYFSKYIKNNQKSKKSGENYKLYESEYNLHYLGNEHFKKLLLINYE